MKRIISILLIGAMLFGGLSLSGSASAPASTFSVKHTIPQKGNCGIGTVFTYNTITKVLHISSIHPDFYFGLASYTLKGDSPFSYSDVKEVIIDDCFRNIGSYMFLGCESLKKVSLPAELATIGKGAFEGCYALRNIEFPSGVKTIGESAFSAAMLEEINLPESVQSIGAFAFYGAAINELELNCPITSIPSYAFGGCCYLKKLVIPDTVTDIANYAFAQCCNLKELTMPCSARIDYHSFEECKSIETMTLSKGMGRMQDFARFIDNEKMHYTYTPQYASRDTLKHIVIEDGVEYIGEYAFCNEMLKKVHFKGMVKQFGKGCFNSFSHCEGNLVFGVCNDDTDILYNLMGTTTLKELVLTDSVGRVWNAPIEACENLQRITVLGMQTDISRLLPNVTATVPLYLYEGSKAQTQADESGVPYNIIEQNCSKTGNHLVSLEPEYLQAPDCTDGGVAVYRCLACGAECAREEVGALSHDYRFVGTTEPGCTRTGEKRYICARCGDIYVEQIPATGHLMKRWLLNEIEPTCQKEGLCYWYCEGECGQYYEKRPVEKTAHIYVSATFPPSCTNEGYTLYTCSSCGDSYKDDFVPVLEHQPGETVIRNRTASTCESEGGYDEVVYCTLCWSAISKAHYTLPRIEHHYSESLLKAGLHKNGSLLKLCLRCGKLGAKSTIYKPQSYTLSQTKYVYSARSCKPSVSVKDSSGKVLKENTDYRVALPKNSKNVGSYSMKVEFIGKYEGTKQLQYSILPKSVPITSVKAAKTGVIVQWKKQRAQTDGYQIRYSASPSFTSYKTITIRSNSVNAKTIRSLKRGTVYYFRVRTFKTVENVNYFSSWSSAKVKTK